jgi:hypothetical protein
MRNIRFGILAAILLSAMISSVNALDVYGNIPIGIDLDNACPVIAENMTYQVGTHLEDPELVTMSQQALDNGWAGRSYAFEGETITFEVDVTDTDGINADCVQVHVVLTKEGVSPKQAGCLMQGLPTNSGKTAHYRCVYTVEPADSGTMGLYSISVQAQDNACRGGGCTATLPGLSLSLNPTVSLSITAQDRFGFMYDSSGTNISGKIYPGMTVYTPFINVENSADQESGLYMVLQMYATDMWDFDHSGAICPTTNYLSADNIDYEATHLNILQPWTQMYRKEANKGMVFKTDENANGNFMGVGDDITMRFRLNIPTPCQGTFDDGGEIVLVGAVL